MFESERHLRRTVADPIEGELSRHERYGIRQSLSAIGITRVNSARRYRELGQKSTQKI